MHKKYFAVPEVLLGFDTETTGLDVNNERAISYGFCMYEHGRPVSSEHFFVRPDRPITPGAQRVHKTRPLSASTTAYPQAPHHRPSPIDNGHRERSNLHKARRF